MVAVAFFVTVLIVDPLGVPASLGFGLSGLISAAVLWWFGRKVHDPSKDKLLEDLETGEMVRLKSCHDFFGSKLSIGLSS